VASFLLRYDRRTGALEVTEYAGAQARERALAARVRAEDERPSEDVEVVALTADSLEELHRTHGRYFFSPAELVRRALDRPGLPGSVG
jgi:hypothetical protein